MAVKPVSEKTDDLSSDSFGSEMDALSRLRHPHILLFLGAITNTQPCFIVMEFAERGSLFDVLGHIALPTSSEKEGTAF